MSSVTVFPPDVWALAVKFGGTSMNTEADRRIIASAIMADRAGRLHTNGLTVRQGECLRIIWEYQRAHQGITPSYDEICASMGLASKSAVTRLVDALVERGRVTRLPNRSRAITIIANPAN